MKFRNCLASMLFSFALIPPCLAQYPQYSNNLYYPRAGSHYQGWPAPSPTYMAYPSYPVYPYGGYPSYGGYPGVYQFQFSQSNFPPQYVPTVIINTPQWLRVQRKQGYR